MRVIQSLRYTGCFVCHWKSRDKRPSWNGYEILTRLRSPPKTSGGSVLPTLRQLKESPYRLPFERKPLMAAASTSSMRLELKSHFVGATCPRRANPVCIIPLKLWEPSCQFVTFLPRLRSVVNRSTVVLKRFYVCGFLVHWPNLLAIWSRDRRHI